MEKEKRDTREPQPQGKAHNNLTTTMILFCSLRELASSQICRISCVAEIGPIFSFWEKTCVNSVGTTISQSQWENQAYEKTTDCFDLTS